MTEPRKRRDWVQIALNVWARRRAEPPVSPVTEHVHGSDPEHCDRCWDVVIDKRVEEDA